MTACAGPSCADDARTTSLPVSNEKLNHLLSVSEVPSWMRDNDFVRTGYRPPQPTLRLCLKSGLLMMSNDFVNIYSHLFGFVALLIASLILFGPATSAAIHSTLPTCLPGVSLPSLSSLWEFGLSKACALTHSDSSSTSAVVAAMLASHRRGLAPLLVAALVCLAFSALYHTFRVRSPRAAAGLVKLDFLGIACLCVGHALTGLYYTYYCRHNLARPYYKLITASFVAVLPAILSPYFATAKARPFRGILFGLLGSVSLFPVLRAAITMKDHADVVAVVSAFVTIAVYAFALIIYVSRFPECCRVGLHDRFFASHQLMHVLVLVGIAIHLAACYYLLTFRVRYGCTISPPW